MVTAFFKMNPCKKKRSLAASLIGTCMFDPGGCHYQHRLVYLVCVTNTRSDFATDCSVEKSGFPSDDDDCGDRGDEEPLSGFSA